jgi:hypothetical protein
MNKLILAFTGLLFILPSEIKAQELRGKDFDLGLTSSDFDLSNKYTEAKLDSALSRINRRLSKLERLVSHQTKRRKAARKRRSNRTTIVRSCGTTCLPAAPMPAFRPMGPPPMMMGGGGGGFGGGGGCGGGGCGGGG